MLCSLCIYSDTVASIVMFTLLMESHKCYLYCDTKIMHIKLVITEIYPIYSEHVIFELEPQKGTQGSTD